jgi:methionyl aminopeptidase
MPPFVSLNAPANTPQSTHKAVHKSKGNFLQNLIAPKVVSEPDPDTGLYNPFPTFPFTGPLRPVYPLSPRRTIPKSIPYPDYALDGIPKSERTFGVRNKIEILDKKGQEGMRKVCRLAREVLDIAAAAAKPGVTTDYIDEIVHKACIERDVGLEFTFEEDITDSYSRTPRHLTTSTSQNQSARRSTR